LAAASAGLCGFAQAQAGGLRTAAAPTLLGVCEGKAGEQKETKTATFVLQAEAPLKIAYDIAANPANTAPKVMVRLQRKLPNGSFVTVKTMTDLDQGGETEAKPFPAGDYKLEVTATQAAFRVTTTRE
jgi:hypothetical protein